MNPFYQALEQGYSPEDILGYISKVIPQIAPTIKKASRAGYTIQQILGFFSKKLDPRDFKGMSESEIHASNRRNDALMTKHGLTMAGAAAAAPIAGIVARNAISRILPSSLTNLSGSLNQGVSQSPRTNIQSMHNDMNQNASASQPTSGLNPVGNNQLISSQKPPVNEQANIPQETNIQQPKISPINPVDLINKHGISRKVDNMLSSKATPEEVSGYFEKFEPKVIKGIEKETGMKFQDVIAEYSKSKSQMSQNEPKTALIPQENEKISRRAEESKPVAKNETVASPQGIGEVKEIRNGQAIVEVDGKKHKVSEDELIQSPLSENDLADLYDDLISGIEKATGEVSKNVYWAGYDPKTNELAYIPHNGALYVYDEISPDDAKQLTDLLTLRKTTGENYIGPWIKGTKSPIGAAMQALIAKLQSERGGKGSEYSGKYLNIYDALEPAKKAAKARYAERKKKAKKPGSH